MSFSSSFLFGHPVWISLRNPVAEAEVARKPERDYGAYTSIGLSL